jgi:hypothetical protein
MRVYFVLFSGLFTISLSLNAQIVKRQTKQIFSKLDSIRINEHFSGDPLDAVYNTLHTVYGLNIVYDTAFCRSKYFNYWFTGTTAKGALEITVRELPLSLNIDSNNNIRITKEFVPQAGMSTPPKPKFTGAAVKHNFALSGRVIDNLTGETLHSASLKVNGTSIGTVTNIDGYYTLLNVPSDTATLTVSYLGYEANEIQLTPTADLNNFTVEMGPLSHQLKQVLIVSTKDELMNLSDNKLNAVKMSPQKLAQLPNIGEKDIMRSFQLLPGVSAANESSSGLYVRGGTPDQNLILYDGFTIYQVDHLYGFFSAFNANALKEVELFKGGFESKYGGRLSSVTEITGKDGNAKQFNMGGEVSLLSANLYTEVPITDNLTFIAAARKSWRGPIYNWIFDNFNKTSGDNQTKQQGPGGGSETVKAKSSFYDANAKLTYRPTKKDVISLSYFSGQDNLDNGFSVNTPSFLASQGININFGITDLTKYGNIATGIKWSRKWTDKFYGNSLVSYSNYYSDRDRANNGTITTSSGSNSIKSGLVERNNLKDLSLKSDYEWTLSKHFDLDFGVFATNYNIKYSYSQNDTTKILDRNNNGNLVGGYLQTKISLFKQKLTFVPGIRLDYFDISEKSYTEPRLASSFKISDKISLKGSYGQYYQFANRITREDLLSGSKDFWLLSNGKNVPVSYAEHYISGLSFENKHYLISVEGYNKNLKDLSQYSLRYSVSNQGIKYNENFYTGTGKTQGVEFLVQKKSGAFSGWVSYTLSKTMYHFSVYSANDYRADQDVRNEFKIVGIYKFKKWDFSATWIYASGKPYTAPSGAYTIKLLDGSTQDFFTVTDKNSLRLPNYHRLDISTNYHLFNAQKKDIGYIGFSIFNVYARENVWYKQYTIVNSKIVETNVDYLGLIPNLTLSLKLR